MAVKRYLLPAVFAVAVYTALGIFCAPREGTYISGLIFTLLCAYFIRVCDDLSDFEADALSGKSVLGKRALFLIFALILILISGLCILHRGLWYALAPVTVLLQFAIPKKRLRVFIKPFFIPAILFGLFNTVFVYSNALYTLCAVAVIIDVAVIYKKRSSYDSDK